MKFVTDVSAEMIWLGWAVFTSLSCSAGLVFCVCAWSLSRFLAVVSSFFVPFPPQEALWSNSGFLSVGARLQKCKAVHFSVAGVLSSRLWNARPVNTEWGFVGNERQMSVCCLTEAPAHEQKLAVKRFLPSALFTAHTSDLEGYRAVRRFSVSVSELDQMLI